MATTKASVSIATTKAHRTSSMNEKPIPGHRDTVPAQLGARPERSNDGHRKMELGVLQLKLEMMSPIHRSID
ncbi:hypothetical protein COCNU_16G004800 [Cocos nucifera]|uniref:Uncharacterized protein n=1 Tax=Cocos nucifera TaxID=13894 RepID=A0A8K0IYC0_COCNU|nr:hypothetical protein COCNU_16G004800 [Cocos nucifera]